MQTSVVKTHFQMSQKISTTKEKREELQPQHSIQRGATILSTVKKIHAKGIDVGVTVDDLKNIKDKKELEEYVDDDDSIHSEDYDDDTDVDLIRAKRAQRERPSTFGNMADIKNKFEAGIEQGREERHQERKEEIQNIRSKLFFGKQARTKEMYQNSLAELETTTKLRNKGFSTAHELDNVKAAAENARNIKKNFETGNVYRKSNPTNQENVDVGPGNQISNKVAERMQMLAKQQAKDAIVKNFAKVKNVETADISNQFEFFENYNPEDHKKKDFGVKQKMTANDKDNEQKQENFDVGPGNQISNKVSERMQTLAKQQAKDAIVKNFAKVKNVETADKQKDFGITPPRENGVKQKVTANDEDDEQKQNSIKIDGLKIDGLKIRGVVNKAKSNYIDRINKSETMNTNQTIENIPDKGYAKQNQTPTKPDATQNKTIPAELKSTISSSQSEENRRFHDGISESAEESVISSKRHGYLDSRTRELKDRFEQWNYENNVYDEAVYNDSIPDYEEIVDSQTESSKTIRAKFERLPHLSKIQRTNQPRINRFV